MLHNMISNRSSGVD